jgi:hypothetical protein
MDVNIKCVTRTTCILSEEPGLICLRYGLLKVLGLLEKLATDVDVCCGGVHATSSNEAALYEFVGITAQDFAVFTCARFSLISIDDEIAGSRM